MITPNDALQFIKDHHNGEIPYMFGKNEYARWMAEFANHTVTKHLHKLDIGGPASASVSDGEQLATEAVDTGVWEGERCPRCKSVNLVDVDDHWTKCRDCKFRFVGG
jgi:hypothetical protein